MSPPRTPPQHATEAELLLLDSLWSGPPQNVRDLAQATGRENPTAAQYATIQRLLDRLERKGLVARDRSQSPHRYRAAIERDAFIGAELESIANRTTGGALLPLLLNLVRRTSLSEADRRRLMDLIDRGPDQKEARP